MANSSHSKKNIMLLALTCAAAVSTVVSQVSALDCNTYSGSAPLIQELFTLDGKPVGELKGSVNVAPAGDGKCDVEFAIEKLPQNVGRLVYYERPSGDTDLGREVLGCEVGIGKKSCMIANEQTIKADSLAIFDVDGNRVYGAAKLPAGQAKPAVKPANDKNTDKENKKGANGNNTTTSPTKNSTTVPAKPKNKRPDVSSQSSGTDTCGDGSGAACNDKNSTMPPPVSGNEPTTAKVITYHPKNGSPPYKCILRKPINTNNAPGAKSQAPKADNNTDSTTIADKINDAKKSGKPVEIPQPVPANGTINTAGAPVPTTQHKKGGNPNAQSENQNSGKTSESKVTPNPSAAPNPPTGSSPPPLIG